LTWLRENKDLSEGQIIHRSLEPNIK